jgi:hypothetical protein
LPETVLENMTNRQTGSTKKGQGLEGMERLILHRVSTSHPCGNYNSRIAAAQTIWPDFSGFMARPQLARRRQSTQSRQLAS